MDRTIMTEAPDFVTDLIEPPHFVSYRFLYWALTPLWEYRDAEGGEYPEVDFHGMDGNNGAEVKAKVIRPLLVPYVNTFDYWSYFFTKDSFLYYLNHTPAPTKWGVDLFEFLLDSLPLPFEKPIPARLFFVWMWEVLYREDYQLKNIGNFVVDNERAYRILVPGKIDYSKFVSERFIYWILGPVSRHDDVEEGECPELEFPGLDDNNSEEVKARVIRPFIVPWQRRYDPLSQRITKNSFRYYLNAVLPKPMSGVEFFQGMFNSMVPSFKGPRPSRLFFVWIWEELYGPEDYHIDSIDDFIVDNARKYWLMVSDTD
jgi:hypothetical protein